MFTVDDYGQIRRAHRDGMSPDVHREAIARKYHHSRRKVREALACPEPKPYTRTKDPPAPKLGPFKPIIDEILKAVEQAPRKQRHTAAQIFRRLQSEQGYAGGYDQVRRYVQKHRRSHRVTFIPLSHDPGQRLECDYGHMAVDFRDGRRQVPVFIAAWAYSNCPFAVGTPTERPKLSDPGRERRGLQLAPNGRVRCSAWLGCDSIDGFAVPRVSIGGSDQSLLKPLNPCHDFCVGR